jgi:3-oxoacyl-[acyl-carrier protein] reductase
MRTRVTEASVMILTGCAAGIGRQLASDLFARGHRLMLTDIDETALSEQAEQHFNGPDRVELVRHDVRDASAWDALVARAVARWGRVDVVMNVAGCIFPGWAHEMVESAIDLTIDVNVKGVIFGTNAAARQMLRQGGGHIINFASLAAIAPIPGIAVYSASKHAVRGFSIAVAQELRPHGIAVTAVCPGLVATRMLDVQLVREEAALSFATAPPLSVEQVSNAVLGRGLERKPLELFVTAPRSGQVLMAKLASMFPALATRLSDRLMRRGRQAQAKLLPGG